MRLAALSIPLLTLALAGCQGYTRPNPTSPPCRMRP